MYNEMLKLMIKDSAILQATPSSKQNIPAICCPPSAFAHF